jgi:hypothetical protein
MIATNGSSIILNSSGPLLNGVTVNGTLDVGNSYSGAVLELTNGLTLNGTMLIGNPTNTWYGVVDIAGTQTLGGNGTVIFGNGNAGYNAMRIAVGGSILTIGSGITTEGNNGTIGDASIWGVPAGNDSVINQGVITVDAGTVVLDAEPFDNQGNAEATTKSTLLLGGSFVNEGTLTAMSGGTIDSTVNLQVNGNGILSGQAGAAIKIGSNLVGSTRNADQYAPLGTTEFQSGAHLLEAMSQDRGNTGSGFVKNFAYGTILLDSSAQVSLVDDFTNSAGPLPACVYANSLVVSPGATLNLDGLHFYAQLLQIGGSVTGGWSLKFQPAVARFQLIPPLAAQFLRREPQTHGHSWDWLANT